MRPPRPRTPGYTALRPQTQRFTVTTQAARTMQTPHNHRSVSMKTRSFVAAALAATLALSALPSFAQHNDRRGNNREEIIQKHQRQADRRDDRRGDRWDRRDDRFDPPA